MTRKYPNYLIQKIKIRYTNREDAQKAFISMMNKKKEDILANIPDESKEIINATTICTIYNGETKTWGIVSRPNKCLITFRLKNPLSTRLKAACRSLILSLHNGSFAYIEKEDNDKIGDNNKKEDMMHNENAQLKLSKFYLHSKRILYLSSQRIFKLFSKGNKGKYFKFSSIIEILEPGSDQSSFHGKIIQGSAFKAAREDKQTEISVMICTFLFTVLLLYITSPLSVIKFSNIEVWGSWWKGNLERVSTAAIVTMLVSSLNLIFHWASISREYPIKWIAEDVSD